MARLLAGLHRILLQLSERFGDAAIDLIGLLLGVSIGCLPLVAVFLGCGLSLVASGLLGNSSLLRPVIYVFVDLHVLTRIGLLGQSWRCVRLLRTCPELLQFRLKVV